MLSCRINVTGNNKTCLKIHVKCPIFLSDFNPILILSSDFHKVPNIKFTKIRQVGAALIRADRWTDMKLTSAFRHLRKSAYKVQNKTDLESVISKF